MTGTLKWMPTEVVPGAGSAQRRARHLIATSLPRRGEAIAAIAVLAVLTHVLFAQLTLVMAVVFTVITRVSRWSLWWLAVPTAAGLAWTLAVGPENAVAGFAAGPARFLGYLGGGPLLVRLGHLSGAFAGAGSWLPRQCPIALLSGTAEAAVAGRLTWLNVGGSAAGPPRPGVLAAARRSAIARRIRSGAVLTSDGCALGVVTATGAVAELRWADIAGGLMVVGAVARQVTVTSLQVVHAALRRRKPLIVIDGTGGAAIASALTAACAATGVPLRLAGPMPADLGQLVAGLGAVVSGRSAVLFTASSPRHAVLAGAAITALGADLRRIGVDGDGIVWLPGAETVSAETLATLIRGGGGGAGLPVLIGTTSPSAAAELAGLVGAILIHRVTDPDLAASLAAQAGPGNTQARRLLSLSPADFMLVLTGRRLTRFGRVVPALLPRLPASAGEAT